MPANTHAFSVDIQGLAKAGVQFGHARGKRHPKMAEYIVGRKDAVEVLDLDATARHLQEAMAFLADVAARGGLVLFVGTSPYAREAVENASKKCGSPYVTERWIGGTLTNFSTVQKRLATLNQLEEQQRSGEIAKYTKREQLELSRKIERLVRELGGIRALTRLPDALVLVTPRNDILAAHEAHKKRIPVVAIIDTNMDPDIATYAVPGNDDALSSIRCLLEKFAEAVNAGKGEGSRE